ncbi:MAG: hypothetical protein KAT58_11730 [candidate division Zixibacteria bacterium]|nr:hypothetical protein [candidate division Zixibacteria bacterium]
MSGGPYLKSTLRVQWVIFWQKNPHLFRSGVPKNELQSEQVLAPYRGREIDNVHAYGLWRLALDFPDSFLSDDDCLRVGQFLIKARLSPKQWAADNAKGLAKAVGRFKDQRPLYEQIFEALHELDLFMDKYGMRNEAQELLVEWLARFNTSPPQLWFFMDKWENTIRRQQGGALLVPYQEERAFAEAFLKEANHPPPDFAAIAARPQTTPIISEASSLRGEALRRRSKKRKK